MPGPQEEEEDSICCICLDEPNETSPLFLIACGCKGAWFHTECENNWIDWGGNPLLCPVCRRIPIITKYYGFHWSIGDIQHYYWRSLFMCSLELLFYTYESFTGVHYAISVPAMSFLFLTMPFILPTHKPYSYYIFNTHMHNFYTLFSYCSANFLVKAKSLSLYEYPLLINVTIIMSFIHYIYVAFDFFITCAMGDTTPDCFHEFVIGRDILHVNTLRITETATDTREGNESGSRRIARWSRGGRQTRSRNHRH
jgi:hypothetical protein